MSARTLTRLAAAAFALVACTAWAAPDIERWRTGNGAEVYFVRAPELPIVDVRLVFDAGAARDGDRPGLARMVSELLLEGTTELDAGEVARRFERYGAQVSTSSRLDSAYVHLRSLAREETLSPVIDHLAHVLTEPAFASGAVQRVRRQMLVSLQRDLQSPDAVADRAFSRAMYGEHPYGNPPKGTPESLKAIDGGILREFHERYYAAGNAVVAVVGDLDRGRAERVAERLSAALPAGKPAPELPPVSMPEPGRTVRVPFDSQQTHVLMGQPVIARGDPDYYALYAANHVLGGGGLVSVLAEEMREKRGLSYSSYSSVRPAAREGPLEVGTQVRNDALTEALEVLRGTLQRFHDEGPAADRLEAAKENITGSFPLNLDSNQDLVGYVAMIGFYDLPPDYLESFRERIASLSPEQVAGTFRRRVAPERMITVLVGPEKVIGADGDG